MKGLLYSQRGWHLFVATVVQFGTYRHNNGRECFGVAAVYTAQCTEQATVKKHTTFVGLIFRLQHVQMYRAVCRYCNDCLQLVKGI